jgi:hypothetical protein
MPRVYGPYGMKWGCGCGKRARTNFAFSCETARDTHGRE